MKSERFWLTVLVLISLAFASSAMAAQFEGDVADSRGIQVFKGHIWVKDSVYRIEMDRPDSPGHYTIVGAKAGTTQVVIPKYKSYMEFIAGDMLSQMEDPFQAAEGNAKRFSVKVEGKETIEGLACERQLVHGDGKEILRRWFSPALNFYIQNEQLLQDDWYVRISNIRQVPVPDTRFQIPGDFVLKTYEELTKIMETDPELAAKMAAHKKNRPRKTEISNLLSADDSWSLVLEPGLKVRVKVKADSETDSWFAIPYKGETPLKPESECTYQGTRNMKFDTGLSVDGIRIGVVQGKNLRISVILVGQKPHLRATKRAFTLDGSSGKGWGVYRKFQRYEVHITALSSPTSGVRFRAEGKEHKEKIPAGQTKRFSFPAMDRIDDLDLMMDHGRIKVVCVEDHRTQAGAHVLLADTGTQDAGTASAQSQTAGATTVEMPSAPAPVVAAPQAASTEAMASRATAPAAATAPKSAPAPAEGGTSQDADAQRTILVLDASGSMWGQIEGRAKIDIAKEVLADLVRDLSDQSVTGLVAYGHRRKGDCQDVEELVPLGPIDKNLLTDKIMAINPKGKTPITLSIRKTAQKLKTVEEEANIILVSDGKETCEGDPCALVKELKAAGVRFTLYVIGFDVNKEEKAQLECMAKAGGGQYFTAKNAQEFRLAANQVVKESQNFGYLKVIALRNETPIPARVDIYPPGAKQALKSVRAVTGTDWPGAKLKPGVYDLTVTDDEVQPNQSVTFSAVSVTAGETTEKSADFSGGELQVAVLANGQKDVAGLYVYPAGGDQPLKTGDTSRDNPYAFVLSPGAYDLRVVYRKSKPETERRFDGISIQSGQTVEKRVEFGEGRLSVEALVNGEKGSVGMYVFEAGTNQRVATGDTSRDNPRIITLNPGTYDLRVVFKGSNPETEQRADGIEILPGRTVEKQFEFGHGRLSVEALVNGKKGGVGLSIFEAGTNKRIATGDTTRDNPKVLNLNAGSYDVKVAYIKAIPKKEIVLQNVRVNQEQTVEQQVTYEEGLLKVNVTGGGVATQGGLYFFRPRESRRFSNGEAKDIIHMQPGQYEVVVKAYLLEGSPEKRVSFAIQQGQTTTVDVAF